MSNRKLAVSLGALAFGSILSVAHADSSGPDEPFKNAQQRNGAKSDVLLVQSFVARNERKSDVVTPIAEVGKQVEQTPSVLDRFDTKLSN